MLLPSRASFAEEAISESENCTKAWGKKNHIPNELVSGLVEITRNTQKMKEKNDSDHSCIYKHTDLEPCCLLKGGNLVRKSKILRIPAKLILYPF